MHEALSNDPVFKMKAAIDDLLKGIQKQTFVRPGENIEVAWFEMPDVKANLPEDPEELDATIGTMQSGDGVVQYLIFKNEFDPSGPAFDIRYRYDLTAKTLSYSKIPMAALEAELESDDDIDINSYPGAVSETRPMTDQDFDEVWLILEKAKDYDKKKREYKLGQTVRKYYAEENLSNPDDDETKRLPPIKIGEQFAPSEEAIQAATDRMRVFLSQGIGNYRFEEFAKKYEELLKVCNDEDEVETIIDRLMIEIEEQNGEA